MDVMDGAPRQISRARSLGSLMVTMEELAPNQSAIIVGAGKNICVACFSLRLLLGNPT